MFVLTLADGFVLCLVYISYFVLALVSGDKDELYRLGRTE
jgi:hypothetical protein